jgi:uncharacterized repeat protein (TIGR01451 family)
MNGSRLRLMLALASALTPGAALLAAEVTVKNDSLTDFGSAVIVTGFVEGERAASWLTTPCTGNIRAVQVFWRSGSGSASPEFGHAIDIFRNGTFPNPGAIAERILAPVLTDGVINEYRFLDQETTVPLVVPVTMGERFVVSLEFETAPPQPEGPSVVRDIDGCQANRNAIFALVGTNFLWVSSCALGLSGDFTIRAVVDCGVGTPTANLSATVSTAAPTYVPGGNVDYTITVANAGPDAATNASIADTFPAAFASVQWACAATLGSSCAPATGTGNISKLITLAPMGSVVFSAQATTLASATGPIVNNASVSPPSGVADPSTGDNIGSASVNALIDPIFKSGFEDSAR